MCIWFVSLCLYASDVCVCVHVDPCVSDADASLLRVRMISALLGTHVHKKVMVNNSSTDFNTSDIQLGGQNQRLGNPYFGHPPAWL